MLLFRDSEKVIRDIIAEDGKTQIVTDVHSGREALEFHTIHTPGKIFSLIIQGVRRLNFNRKFDSPAQRYPSRDMVLSDIQEMFETLKVYKTHTGYILAFVGIEFRGEK